MRLLSRRPRQDHQSDGLHAGLCGSSGSWAPAGGRGDRRGAGGSTTRPYLALEPVSATIVPGISILTGHGPSVAYAIETSDGLVFIDSGLEPDARPLKRSRRRGSD